MHKASPVQSADISVRTLLARGPRVPARGMAEIREVVLGEVRAVLAFLAHGYAQVPVLFQVVFIVDVAGWTTGADVGKLCCVLAVMDWVTL